MTLYKHLLYFIIIIFAGSPSLMLKYILLDTGYYLIGLGLCSSVLYMLGSSVKLYKTFGYPFV